MVILGYRLESSSRSNRPQSFILSFFSSNSEEVNSTFNPFRVGKIHTTKYVGCLEVWGGVGWWGVNVIDKTPFPQIWGFVPLVERIVIVATLWFLAIECSQVIGKTICCQNSFGRGFDTQRLMKLQLALKLWSLQKFLNREQLNTTTWQACLLKVHLWCSYSSGCNEHIH